MTDGLRERKKGETRRALMYSALELFTRRGYDEVTADEIAAAANVSTRTFFRYYKQKADAVFGLHSAVLEPLLVSKDVWAEAVAQIRSYAERVAADPQLYATQIRLSLNHPPVRARRVEIQLEYEDAVYAGYRREHPDATPVACRMAATTTVHVSTAAMETWVEAGAPEKGPAFEEGLALAKRQVELLLGQ